MDASDAFRTAIPTVTPILAAMAAVAAIERVIPLHARTRWNRAHLAPNLALTAVTFATNLFFNAALVAALAAWDGGLLRAIALPPIAATAIAVAGLDFSFYVAHRAMHRVPLFWRFHRVHHADPVVDVTTTIRQHPGEGVIRYAFLAAFGLALGASPAAFAIYRLASVLNGLLEHANMRLPRRLDTALSALVTSPNLHKVHHSRVPTQTDSNYGNLLSLFDRGFGTFTPATQGIDVTCGLDGFDDEELQSTARLLVLPFSAPANLAAPSPVLGSVASATERDHDVEARTSAISTGIPVMNA